jgi:hypothetical protein
MIYPLNTPVPLSNDGVHQLQWHIIGEKHYVYKTADGGKYWQLWMSFVGEQSEARTVREFAIEVQRLRGLLGWEEKP